MLKTFLLMPFIFSLLLGSFMFLKNPIYIRRIAKSLYFIQFIISSIVFLCFQNESFNFLNINFEMDKISQYILFLSNFIFFIFSIISKKFILKLSRVFYAISFLLLGLINFTILSDNVFIIFISIFWINLVVYFLNISYCKKENKKNVIVKLTNDIFWFFIALCLILKDFARYFVLNEINFSFSNIIQNLYKFDESSVILAFFGFLIIILKLFNFIPFCAKYQTNLNYIPPYITTINSVSNLILGGYLFLKIYNIFDYLFYQYQGILAIFLLINFIIFSTLTLRQKNFFKFLFNLLNANLIVAIFAVFSFEDECMSAFLYYLIILIVSYSLCSIVLTILADKFKTLDFDELRKITDKTKITQLFILFSFLNFSSTPLLAIFSAQLICFSMIFATDYDSLILNVAPYVLIIGIFLLSLAVLGVLYKILIAPIQKEEQLAFCNHQIIVCAILAFAIIILGFCPEYLFNQITSIVDIGNY